MFKFDKVKSTNDKAVGLIKNENIYNGFVSANEQTKGKGRLGKKWISLKGNLFLSIFFMIEKKCPNFNEFFYINPVLIFEILSHYCNKKKISFKWPNDILINKKKVCGILQETLTYDDKKFFIIGIGINTNLKPALSNSSSIYAETNNLVDMEEILKKIIYKYTNFLKNLNEYNLDYFKKTAENLSIKLTQ